MDRPVAIPFRSNDEAADAVDQRADSLEDRDTDVAVDLAHTQQREGGQVAEIAPTPLGDWALIAAARRGVDQVVWSAAWAEGTARPEESIAEILSHG
ncbi:MAG TPA: hypothetical protein VKV73_06325 [Chloroflexota bacterium]|nr:hypothetical protein [Chloroflexota bacterium]